MSFAEWRAVLEGYVQRLKLEKRRSAWVLSYQLIAAGCEADKVTPAKLMGEKERPVRAKKSQPTLPIDELFKLMKKEGAKTRGRKS